jgi:site-specific DNA-methyltransferase (adenine-specific)
MKPLTSSTSILPSIRTKIATVLFAGKSGARSAAQIKAFEDTWRWYQGAALAYQQTVEAGEKVSQVMQAFRQFLGENDMLGYLAMMAPQLALCGGC